MTQHKTNRRGTRTPHQPTSIWKRWTRTRSRRRRQHAFSNGAVAASCEVVEPRVLLTNHALDLLDYDQWRSTSLALDPVELDELDHVCNAQVSLDSAWTQDGVSTTDADATSLIGLPDVFESTPFRGQGYSVAVLDTGINYNHPNLGGGWGERVIAGWDFINNDADPFDDNGHGTHVAGIIGSDHEVYTGVAPEVNLIALKVLGANGSGTFGAVQDALQWVIEHRDEFNIVAVNMSLGAGNYSFNPLTYLDDEFSTLVDSGVFLSAASGNSFYSYGSAPGLGAPAISDYTVSVGAVWDANVGSVHWGSGAQDVTTAPDRLTSFTQRNSQLDILAPGAFLTNTSVSGGFTTKAGTSMAAPIVAGAAALLHEALIANGQSELANQDDILSLMQTYGVTIVDGDDEVDNVDNTGLSFQRLDIAASIQAIVLANNSAPVLGQLEDIEFSHAVDTVDVHVSVSDADGDHVVLSAVAVAANNLDGPIPVTVAFTGNQLTIDPAADFTGSFAVIVTGSDGVQSVSTELLVTVTNAAPILSELPDLELSRNATLQIVLAGHDADGDSLSYAAWIGEQQVDLIDNQLLIDAVAYTDLELHVIVAVSDGLANAEQSFVVTITNTAPTLAEFQDFELGRAESRLVELLGQDADGDALSYAAWINDQPVELNGNQLLIDPAVYGVSELHVTTIVSDGMAEVQRSFVVAIANSAPTLDEFNDRQLAFDETLLIALAALDADGDDLTYSAVINDQHFDLDGDQLLIDPANHGTGELHITVSVSDGLASAEQSFVVSVDAVPTDPHALQRLAVQLDEELGLRSNGRYYENWQGRGEKWIRGVRGWYFIEVNGDLKKWAGSVDDSPHVATLDESYHHDPRLLTNAAAYVQHASEALPSVALEVDERLELRAAGRDYENSSGLGEKWFRGAGRAWYFITPDGAVHRWQRGVAVQNSLRVVTLSPSYHANPSLLYNAVEIHRESENQAVALDLEFGIRVGRQHYWENSSGLGEKWVRGSNREWFFITPDGDVYQWVRGSVRRSQKVATLDPSYHNDPTLLTNAAEDRTAETVAQQIGLYLTGNLYENSAGMSEKWLRGKDRQWYFITPDGTLRQWRRGVSIRDSRVVARLDVRYYETTTLDRWLRDGAKST